MKQAFILLFTCCFFYNIGAQKPYFQQEVRYTINVTLDDQQHTLTGNIEIEYINHSPDQLDFIYLHLWGNAYQNRNTAFAKQKLRSGDTKFYFANNKDLGGYSNLAFTVDGQSAVLELQKDNPDIAILHLPKPLASDDSINIATPFQLKIPASFSRLGHVGESYQITQWYPKPAVYDRDGWHAMPYLDQGEFYSEFGTYDVSITLPQNYVVGATGTLQTEREKAFLQQKIIETNQYFDTVSQRNDILFEKLLNNFPTSSTTMKTIRYTAEKVHDFAWFADKRFKVRKGEVTLTSGRTVDTWVMFTAEERNLWKDAINYVNRSVKFYSDLMGEYPYPQATAVQSALSAGAGMEYPMITVIGMAGSSQSLDIVITHEVGHNWFYGVLGSNERDHPWMDEGINTYYEKRYTKQYYKTEDDSNVLPAFMLRGSDINLSELTYLWQARLHRDQAPDSNSDAFTNINYFLGAYEKPAMILQYLEQYLGTEKFDAAMQEYFQQWQFKHPQPNDFRQVLESTTGKDLSWLFDGLLYSNKQEDYAIVGLQDSDGVQQVIIKNKGNIAGPFTLDGITDGKVEYTQWYEGFTGERALDFPEGYENITLDAGHITLDVNRKNNHISASGNKIEPLQVRFLPGPENDKRTQLFWLPAMAWNNYDKYMLGLVLYNTTIPFKNFDFTLVPMYSFALKDIAGVGEAQYHIYPQSKYFQNITFGLGARTFHYNRRYSAGYDLKYARLMPFVKLELGKKPASNFYQTLQWRMIWLDQEFPKFDPTSGNYKGNRWTDTFIHGLSYFGENRRVLNPFSVLLAFEQQSYTYIGGDQHYLKASLELKQSFTYASKKNIDFRIFAGSFLSNTRRNAGAIFPGAFNLTSQGFNDYRYDDFYFGRNENQGIWSQQITIRDGGLKNVIGSGFSLGRSNNYILALNIKADLPNKLPLNLPLKPYFDIGYFDNAMPTGTGDTLEDQVLWSGGVMLEFVKDIAVVYFPLVNSKNIQDRYAERGNYLQRIAFTLDLQKLNPKELLKRIEF